MISKELLSEIMDDKVKSIRIMNDTIFIYFENNNQEYFIDIYELAYKCKVWAYNNSYTLRSQLKVCYCRFPNHNDIEEKIFKADTEPEAIFKACQWILENRQKGKI